MRFGVGFSLKRNVPTRNTPIRLITDTSGKSTEPCEDAASKKVTNALDAVVIPATAPKTAAVPAPVGAAAGEIPYERAASFNVSEVSSEGNSSEVSDARADLFLIVEIKNAVPNARNGTICAHAVKVIPPPSPPATTIII